MSLLRNQILRIVNYQLSFLLAGIFFLFTNSINAQLSADLTKPEFSETVWISTERSLYIPGEKINFSAIVLETDSYIQSELSKILKVELLDSTGKGLEQKEFIISEGRVNQSITIPQTSYSGWYYLRAYTNWMRNSVDGISNYLGIKVAAPGDLSKYLVPDNNGEIKASISPENNSLTIGRNNNCAIRITTSEGLPMSCDGYLISSSNDTVSRFSSDSGGWGLLSFTPKEGMNYEVAIPEFSKSEIRTLIPEQKDDQAYVSFDKHDTSINLDIEDCLSKNLKLIVHRYYTWYESLSVQTIDGKATFDISTRNLPNGIFQLSLYDENNSLIYSRLFINSSLTELSTRSGINLSENNDGSVSAKLSFVREKSNINRLINSFVGLEEPSNEYSNVLPGIPGWHFSFDIPAEIDAREAWLIANSYPENVCMAFFNQETSETNNFSIDWSIPVITRESSHEYIPETRGTVLTGTVTDSTNTPVEGVTVSATFLSDNSFYSNNTFPSGRFYILFPEHKENEDIIVSFIHRPDNAWNLSISPRFDSRVVDLPKRAFYLSEEEALFISGIDINRQLNSIYSKNDIVEEEPLSPHSLLPVSFVRNPDRITLVEDFIRLNNIREIIYEVVPNVTARQSDGNFYLNVVADPPIPSNYKALVLLDGIPLFDFNEFLSLPVDRLLEIRQIDRVYMHGNAIFGGIISFQTVNNDLGGLDLPQKSQLLTLDMPTASINYDVSEGSSSVTSPRLSATLFRRTFESSPKDFIIFPNDMPGKYKIQVSGFTGSGEWVFVQKSLTLGKEGFIIDGAK